MLTLAAWLSSEDITPADFARRLAKRLGWAVSDQNIWRWTREPNHPDFSIPRPDAVVAIYLETGKQVSVDSWYAHLVSAAARKAAARRRAAKASKVAA